MPRKAKKRVHKMPPLSVVDKLIYWMILLTLCAGALGLMFGSLILRDRIAFSDEMVIATEDAASLWLLVPVLTFFLMTFIFWQKAYHDRKPIFGKKNLKYGPPAWPKVYPLFMKNKPPVWVSERKKKEKKQIAILLVIVLLLSFIPLLISLYGRVCLRKDGSVVRYNTFNRQIQEFTADDISGVEMEIYPYRTGKYLKRNHWGVQIVIETDNGKKYTFKQSEFRSDAPDERLLWLDLMLEVKNRYAPGVITYEGLENLEYVIYDKNLGREEIEKLCQLFGR